MHSKKLLVSFFFSLFFITTLAYTHDEDLLLSLYNSLDPNSISEHLAFYKLYSNTSTGKKALRHIQTHLLVPNEAVAEELPFSTLPIEAFVSLMLGKKVSRNYLEETELQCIEALSSHFPNKKLKGHKSINEKEILDLDPSEIDLSRALLMTQNIEEEIDWMFVRNYEALLDFMALQISAQLPKEATHLQKIDQINQFIFFDSHYRFPAHSQVEEKTSAFSSLSLVLDSKKGICLGTTLLYLCLAQRLDLPLEIMIPPGHIFVRYRDGDFIRNIETTARGISVPTEIYLNINTKSLKQATLKEVLGFVHFNSGSQFLTNDKDYIKAIASYEKAIKFAPSHDLAHELLAYAHILGSQEKAGKKYLRRLSHCSNEDVVVNTFYLLISDYLKGRISKDALRIMFDSADADDLPALQKRHDELFALCENFKYCWFLWYCLAETELQLNHQRKAITALEKCHSIDSNHPSVEFLLTQLYIENYNYPKAWQHFKKCEEIAAQHNFKPKSLKDLRIHLTSLSMETF